MNSLRYAVPIILVVIFLLIAGCTNSEKNLEKQGISSCITDSNIKSTIVQNNFLNLEPNYDSPEHSEMVAGDTIGTSLSRIVYNFTNGTDDAVIVFVKTGTYFIKDENLCYEVIRNGMRFTECPPGAMTPDNLIFNSDNSSISTRTHAIFLKHGNSGNLSGFGGYYDIFVTTGKNWDWQTKKFKLNPKFFKTNENMVFTSTRVRLPGTAMDIEYIERTYFTQKELDINNIDQNPLFKPISESEFIDLSSIQNTTEIQQDINKNRERMMQEAVK